MTKSTQQYDPLALYVHDEQGIIRNLKNAAERTPLKYSHLLRAELFSPDLIIPPEAELVISGGLRGNWPEVAKKLRNCQRFVLHTNDPRIRIPEGVIVFTKGDNFLNDIDTIIEKYFPNKWFPK